MIMGILNVTPDSFADGGRHADKDSAVEHALQMVADGADIIDVGGESTRPGAAAVGISEELDRVVPVIAAIRQRSDVPISVDTSKPEVMAEAAKAGASMINDVTALQASGSVELVAQLGLPVCLMHMQGTPRTMQENPHYEDVAAEVSGYLLQRAEVCMAAGIDRDKIVLDPGFGFGKTLQHNMALLGALEQFSATGYRILVGVSRKSMIGALLDDSEADRLIGSVVIATYAARSGAHIVRVHDVRQTRDALRIESALADCV